MALLLGTALLGTACRAVDQVDSYAESGPVDTATTVPSAVTKMPLVTYDGSGQVVHPDYLKPVQPWTHRPKYLAATPYPFSNQRLENPTLYSGSDGMHWNVAPGTPNPVVSTNTGFLSDPDIVYANLRNEIFLYYRQNSDSDRVYLTHSENGTSWQQPVRVLSARSFTMLSPSVVRRNSGDWLMWSVNATGGCDGPTARVEMRRSTDGISWSAPAPVTMNFTGAYPWHIDVQWIPTRREYWALVPVKVAGTCITQSLYLARSPDGVQWTTLPNPVMRAGAVTEFRDIVYRSTFAYDPSADNVTLWVSGARFTGSVFEWSTAALRRPRSWLFDPVARAQVAAPAPYQRSLIDSLFVPPALPD